MIITVSTIDNIVVHALLPLQVWLGWCEHFTYCLDTFYRVSRHNLRIVKTHFTYCLETFPIQGTKYCTPGTYAAL